MSLGQEMSLKVVYIPLVFSGLKLSLMIKDLVKISVIGDIKNIVISVQLFQTLQ